ncbi:O-antigen ligase [mine drainage metagenome]|uniref:O-antigen ligase n=1 Tax=mine drainage metagenome TaxID=410659 RepID=A0A1J5RUM7_9ZZZZ
MSYFFNLTYARVLSLLIFIPAFFSLRKKNDTTSFGRTLPDKALIAYLLLTAILCFREGNITSGTGIVNNQTLTNSLREIFYLFIDIFLPYFVISRSLKNFQSIRDAILSLAFAIMVLAPLALFESLKGWLLYSSLSRVFELGGGMGGYQARDGVLRALVTAGHSIALGYLMVVGIGLYLFLQSSIQQKFIRRFGMALLVAGLIVPVARGPWIGSIVLLVVFILTGRNSLQRLMILAMMAIISVSLISIFPGGERVINLLPFIGSTNIDSINYRERLLTNSMIVIQHDPWFGSIDYLDAPEMQSMRQGEGIIDLVNTYIWVALDKGLVGLGLFVNFFALTLFGIFQAMRSIPDRDSEEYLLGRVLLATLLAILVIIYTVSSITVVPIVYWSFASLGVAYAQMIKKQSRMSNGG